MNQYILEAREIVYCYPDGTEALKGLTMKIVEGQKIAVLGANGAGKSTLFLHFNGIIRPQRGKIMFMGQELSYRHSSLLELRQNVGIVFQDPDGQLFSASVLQDVSFGPLNLGLTPEEALARSKQAMLETEIEDLGKKPTHFLSYGQKKRVSIAGVLSMNPKVIIFDEPTACLDPQMTRKIMDLLYRLNEQGKTLILSTHDVDLAYSWADYIFLLKQGTIAGEGTPREIFANRELLRQCGLTSPWVMEVYRELVNGELLPENVPVPQNKEELFRLIRGAAASRTHFRPKIAGHR